MTRRKSGACLRCAVVGSMSRRNATRIVSVYLLVFHTVDCFLRTLSFAFPSAPFGVTDTPVIAHPYDMPPRQPFFISDGFWCHSWLVLAQFASIFISFLLTQITPRHDNTTYTFPSATELIPPGFHRYTSSLPISAHQSLAPIIRISRPVFSPFLRYYSHPIFTRLQCLTLHVWCCSSLTRVALVLPTDMRGLVWLWCSCRQKRRTSCLALPFLLPLPSIILPVCSRPILPTSCVSRACKIHTSAARRGW